MSEGDNVPEGPAGRWQGHQARSREAALAERRASVERLRAAMPLAMRERRQWLLWRFMPRPGAAKPPKVPFYACGQLRGWPKGKPRDGKPTDAQPQVPQGHELDRAQLVPLDEAIAAYLRRPDWSGIGFAFLPGDGLIGVDIDHAVDEQGAPSDLCRQVVEMCASYTEMSPSGRGVHIIVAGETKTFKDDAIGLEVYCNAQYFTCTGLPPGAGWPATPAEVQPIDPTVLAYLRELVTESQQRQADAKQAAALAKLATAALPEADAPPAPAPPASLPRTPTQGMRPPAPVPVGAVSGGDDFKRVNDAAMASLPIWVPRLFADAKPWRSGYRITSKVLGRDLQEDLAIQADGIVDFGVKDMGDARKGKRSPVDLVMEWGSRVGVPAAKPVDAMTWLAEVLGVQLTPPPRRAPPPRAEKQLPPAPAPDSPGRNARRSAPEQGKGADQPGEEFDDASGAEEGGGRTDGKGKKIPPEVWAQVEALSERFALVYGTDTAWDREKLMLVKVPAMRLAFGKTAVGLWLSRPYRDMVDAVDLVFEPGEDVAPPRINMWAGLDLQPQVCERADVAPMLDLLQHLCSETRIVDAEGRPKAGAVDEVMHWLLCWQALPLQQLGTKLATAVVMHGAQGTGKNLYFDAWRDLYGAYGITVTQTELEDKYNGWVSRKMAAVGDEVVSRAEMYHNKNRLKLIVTQRDKFAIRDLYAAVRWESNHMNVVFLSNESEPLVLEDRDRRYLVIYTPLEAPVELYQRVRDFLAAGGLAKWLDFLQQYDIGDFDAHAKPPFTEAKRALIEANWRPSVRFVHEWLEGFLELPHQVCSAEQLYRAFRWWCDKAGERWPPSQSKFTAEVNRWVSESRKRGPDGTFPPVRLAYKVIALAEANTARKSTRCFIPHGCQPMAGVSEGAWAADAVKTFDHQLWVFMGRRTASDDDAEGKAA